MKRKMGRGFNFCIQLSITYKRNSEGDNWFYLLFFPNNLVNILLLLIFIHISHTSQYQDFPVSRYITLNIETSPGFWNLFNKVYTFTVPLEQGVANLAMRLVGKSRGSQVIDKNWLSHGFHFKKSPMCVMVC